MLHLLRKSWFEAKLTCKMVLKCENQEKNYAIGYWIFVILCKILIVINDGLLTFLKFLTAWVLFEAGFGHTWLRSEHSWTVPLVQKQLTFGDLLLIGVSSLLYVLDSLILWVFLLSLDIEFFVCLADDMIKIEFFAKWVLEYAAIQMNVHVCF